MKKGVYGFRVVIRISNGSNMEYQSIQTTKGLVIEKLVQKRIYDRSAYFLSKDEVAKLKEVSLTFGDNAVRYFVIISLGINCGLRRSEIANIKINQINLKDNMLEFGLDTKTKTPRRVPITEELRKYILMLMGNRTEGYLILHDSKTNSEKRYSLTQINNIVGLIGKKAGLEPKGGTISERGEKLIGLKNINPHLLRVSWAKLCQKAGMLKEHVRIMGGWHTTKMLDFVYATPDYESVKSDYIAKINW